MADKKYVLDDGGIEREVISRKEAKEKGLKYYFTGKPCSKGHVNLRYVSNKSCVSCTQQWFLDNPEKVKVYRERYKANNLEKRRERGLKWYYNNKHKVREYQQRPEVKERRRVYAREYAYEKYRTDEDFKVKRICRSMLARLTRQLKQDKVSKTESSLGYSAQELKLHMESLMLEGMTWGNYGEWHIDHKKSVKTLLKEGITDPSKINRLSNLIPMWSEHNLRKNSMDLVTFIKQNPELEDMYSHFTECS